MSDLGQNIYSLLKDGKETNIGFLAVPDRFIMSQEILMPDGTKRFFVGVPNVQDVGFDKLEKKVYNYVALTTNQDVSFGTFKILDTEKNKGAYQNGKDAKLLSKGNIDTDNRGIELFITKKDDKTFAVYEKGLTNEFDKKFANLIPRVEADGKVFFIIDFAQESPFPGIGFAITQEKLTDSSFTDGKYDIATGERGVGKGTLKGTTFISDTGNEDESIIKLTTDSPWTGMAQYQDNGVLFTVGFPVNGNEFYGIGISKMVTTEGGVTFTYDGTIATKAD